MKGSAKNRGSTLFGDGGYGFLCGPCLYELCNIPGTVRMRTASINLDWDHDSLQVGFVSPLISPFNPTSYATVAEPALAGAGNLWTWAPQLRYAHQLHLQSGRRLQLELGLWDPPTAGYSTNELFRDSQPR